MDSVLENWSSVPFSQLRWTDNTNQNCATWLSSFPWPHVRNQRRQNTFNCFSTNTSRLSRHSEWHETCEIYLLHVFLLEVPLTREFSCLLHFMFQGFPVLQRCHHWFCWWFSHFSLSTEDRCDREMIENDGTFTNWLMTWKSSSWSSSRWLGASSIIHKRLARTHVCRTKNDNHVLMFNWVNNKTLLVLSLAGMQSTRLWLDEMGCIALRSVCDYCSWMRSYSTYVMDFAGIAWKLN